MLEVRDVGARNRDTLANHRPHVNGRGIHPARWILIALRESGLWLNAQDQGRAPDGQKPRRRGLVLWNADRSSPPPSIEPRAQFLGMVVLALLV